MADKRKAPYPGQHANPGLDFIFFFPLAAIIFLAFMIAVNPVFSQVYNYTPVNHYDIEANPAVLASHEMNNRVQLIHQNAFSSASSFSFSSLRVSKYFEPSFLGLGLSLNNTNVSDSISYSHITIGAGYRNVLFNKAYVKLGVTYKLITTNTPSGNFDYYSFESSGQNSKRRMTDNFNLALSFTSSHDRYYFSLGLLNSNLPWNQSNKVLQFPKYYVMNIGNLMSFFDKRNSEISYSAFIKSSEKNNTSTFSQYIYFKFHFILTRYSGLNYGSRIGFAENDYYQLVPFLAYYKEKFVINFSYNFYLDKVKFDSEYYSTAQLSIIYIL